ncbi:MAG: hypothetical protein KGM42_02550 [Hyphomicrobiales bacterium]|nr:hypothetical protein [Hyphomicrobiales bacterium]
MRLRILLLAVLSLSIAGCGKKTQEVSATYVPASQYDGYLCSQLRNEAARVSRRAAEVFGDRNMKASAGAVIYWPKALLTKTSGGDEAEVARLKGQMTAIQQASDARMCGIEFQTAGDDAAAAPRYDAGGVRPDARASIGNSLYNLPPKSPAH